MSKRVAQRQASRVVREQLAKERRRRRTLWISITAVIGVAIAGLVGWGIYASQRSGTYATPRHASADASGISIGTGAATVDVYLDFLCPACKQFEAEAGETLDKLVAENKATVTYHPLAFLDRLSTNQYSTRSAAVSGCAADGDRFIEFAAALYDRQPAEGGPGLTDDELIQVGGSVGLIDPAFAHCVRSETYRSWVSHVTDSAGQRGVTGTPTVFVNGKETTPTSAAILAAVEATPK